MKLKEKASVYKFLRFLIMPFFKLYYNPKIIGKEFIPRDGSLIVAGNHKHAFDQFSVIGSTKRVIHYMAKKEYFEGKHSLFGNPDKPSWLGRKISKWLVENAGCISVDRNIKDHEATDNAKEVLHNNWVIGLFPEGTRNRTDAFLLPFKFGVVSLASKCDATILPFGVTGDYKFRSKNLIIRFGKPFKVGKMTLEEANDKLYKEVSKLMNANLKESEK